MGYEIMHSYRIKEFRNLHIANKVTHLAIVTIVVNRGVSFFFSFLFWLFWLSSSPNGPSWIVLKDGRLKLDGKVYSRRAPVANSI